MLKHSSTREEKNPRSYSPYVSSRTGTSFRAAKASDVVVYPCASRPARTRCAYPGGSYDAPGLLLLVESLLPNEGGNSNWRISIVALSFATRDSSPSWLAGLEVRMIGGVAVAFRSTARQGPRAAARRAKAPAERDSWGGPQSILKGQARDTKQREVTTKTHDPHMLCVLFVVLNKILIGVLARKEAS